MGEIPRNQNDLEGSFDDSASLEQERADLLLMVEYAGEGIGLSEKMRALVLKHPKNKYLRDIFDRFMGEAGRDWSDIAAHAAELENGHYELPEQEQERGFRQ